MRQGMGCMCVRFQECGEAQGSSIFHSWAGQTVKQLLHITFYAYSFSAREMAVFSI